MGAFVVKDARGRSPFWYAVFRDATGRRLKKSTQLTSKSKALEVARTLDKAYAEARRRTLTEARVRELLSDVLQVVSGDQLRVFTVAEWFAHFSRQKAKTQGGRAAARHRQMLKEFVEFLGPRARLNIAAITSKDVSDFRDHRIALGLAPSTINADVVTIGAAFTAAWKQGHIPVNPCAVLEPLKNKARRKAVFTPEQVSALVKAAQGDWRGLILTAFYTGSRLHDAANLRWRNVDLVGEIKTIRFEQSKTDYEVVTAIHPALEDYLLSLPTAASDEAFLFPSLAGRVTSPLSKEFRALMQRARIEQRVIRERATKSGRSVSALSFHSLRHSFNSILANQGVAEELRMMLTGHSSKLVHKIYTHHELGRLQSAINVLPRL
jgi:site-specific recombinase XerD